MASGLGSVRNEENVIGVEVFSDWLDILHGSQHVAPVRHHHKAGLREQIAFLIAVRLMGVVSERRD